MTLRLRIALAAALCAMVWIGVLSALLPAVPSGEVGGRFAGDFLLDRNTTSFPYPFTLQNLMWLVFFLTCGELLVRYIGGNREAMQLSAKLLPEDDSTILRKRDLGGLYKQVRASSNLLQRMVARCMLAFQTDGAKAPVIAIFNSTLDLYQHEIELRYNFLRYLVWLIPTLGFIGTVVGIALALSSAGATVADSVAQGALLTEMGPILMQQLTQTLGVAFYTTLLALLQSALLMCTLHLVQGREENALNRIGQYCLDNLINRLYEE